MHCHILQAINSTILLFIPYYLLQVICRVLHNACYANHVKSALCTIWDGYTILLWYHLLIVCYAHTLYTYMDVFLTVILFEVNLSI